MHEHGFVVNVQAAVWRPRPDGDGVEYLLGRRAEDEEHAAGQWSFVGGKVESVAAEDSVLAATARRECREEVGVELRDLAYVTDSGFVSDTGAPVVNVVLRARWDGGEPEPRDPKEVAAVEWLAPETVRERDAIPAFTVDYLDAAERQRRSAGMGVDSNAGTGVDSEPAAGVDSNASAGVDRER
jgi:8-oxo-dGTP diphosphatase